MKLSDVIFPSVTDKHLQSTYLAPVKKISYYSFKNETEGVRAAFITMYAIAEFDTFKESSLTWIASLIDAGFPGILTSPLLTPVSFNSSSIDFGLPLLPDFIPNPARVSDSSLTHAYILLSTLLFAIGKTPTDENISAFTEKRVMAVMRKAQIDPDNIGILAPEMMPPVACYKVVNGVFNLRLKLKHELVTNLLAWGNTLDLTPEQEIVWTTLKLWENSGMNHVMLIMDLIKQYPDQIMQIPSLRSQAVDFVNEYHRYANANVAGKKYQKVLFGDRSTFFKAKDFKDLLATARTIAISANRTLENYAPQLRSLGSAKKLIQLYNIQHPEAQIEEILEDI